MLLELSRKITKPFEIMTLGRKGLKLDLSAVKTSMYNNKDDVNMAMYDVLEKWRVSQPDAKTAYDKLYEALTVVNMDSLIQDVLE